MEMTLDAHHLTEYVQDASQEAFAKIVAEHIDLVYAAALRQLRNSAAAEDVTQRVFVLFARKARTLSPEVVLAGWLLNSTRFIARDYQRAEARRKKHEHGAAVMKTQQANVDWERIEPLLDDALAEMGETNRLPVILKYLQSKTAFEIAKALGISEEAARKRISRGLEELQNIFRARGIVLTSDSIGSILGTFAIKLAPSELTVCTTAAVAHVSGPVAVSHIAKLKMACSLLAAITIGGGALIGGEKWLQHYRARVAVALPGNVSVAPAAADMLTGRVFDTRGHPVVGAKIIVATPQDQAGFPLPTGRRLRNYPVTDSTGRYSVPQPVPPYALFIANDDGFAQATWQQLADVSDLILRPWARIEGVLKAGDIPQPREQIELWRVAEHGDPWEQWVHIQGNTMTDATGHYIFPRVPPGEVWLSHQLIDNFSASTQWRYVQIASGQTVQVPVGGSGQSVIGRVAVPADVAPLIDWKSRGGHSYLAEIRREDVSMDGPKHKAGETPEAFTEVQLQFGKTQIGQMRNQWMFGYSFLIRPDGTFIIDDLPPGKYRIEIRNLEEQKAVRFNEDVANGRKEFAIPAEMIAGKKPLDIGVITLKAVDRPAQPGQQAPEFVTKTIDGKTWRLVDQHGKVVVLIFWSTYRTSEELDQFGEFAKRWGNDPGVALLGVCVPNNQTAAEIQNIRRIADEHNMRFPQTPEGNLCTVYDNSWPSAVLIGRDGNVVQKHLDGQTLENTMGLEMRK
jgi:RNA polymerase sigma factor (sigma-70 family)